MNESRVTIDLLKKELNLAIKVNDEELIESLKIVIAYLEDVYEE